VDDGCDGTLNCGSCEAGYICLFGFCSPAQDKAPVLSLAAQNGQDFTLQWTYKWGNFVSSQDHYQLQESTGGSYETVLDTAPDDRTSPYAVDLSRSPGSYSFRVRASTQSGWSDFSNVVPVQVVHEPAVLRLVNDLYPTDVGDWDWSRLNQIYKVWIADSEAALYACEEWTCGRLDSGSCTLPGGVISPGGDYEDFDVSNYADGEYWVYMEVGWWDLQCIPGGSCCFQGRNTGVANCDGECCAYKWAVFWVNNHYSGSFSVYASWYLPQTHYHLTGFCP